MLKKFFEQVSHLYRTKMTDYKTRRSTLNNFNVATKDFRWHIQIYMRFTAIYNLDINLSTASSYTTPPSSPPNPDTSIASSGTRLRLSFDPTIWTGRLTSLWSSHGSLYCIYFLKDRSKAPSRDSRSWFSVGPRRSMHTVIFGTRICPLRAITSLRPDVPASFRKLATHSLDTSVPCPTHPHSFSLSFS
jgi:hypothetical protein